MTGGGHGRPRRRTRTAGLVLLALLVLLVGGVGWLWLRLDGNISTFDADGLSKNRPGAGAAGSNVLVIGSDSRAGDNRRLGGGEGDVGRSDTAFLLHVHGDGRHAVAVSIPRDTLVDIPPCRLPDGSWTAERPHAMFNSAFTVGESPKGNPACTQNTVERLTGLRVDHTVVVDFAGFSAMTEAVGGVEVCSPTDVYEGDLNPNRDGRGQLLFRKGLQKVSGQRALDYVRVRHGIGDGSDIGRIQRQQAFLSAMVKKVRDRGLGPTTLLPLADAATKSLTVDPGLGSADRMLSFAMSLRDIDLHELKFVTLPWRYDGNRVAVVQPDADNLWAMLRADRTVDGKEAGKGAGKGAGAPSAAAAAARGAQVALVNGTDVDGLAARAAAMLKGHGVTVTGTSTASAQDEQITVVDFGPGEAAHARAVAELFPGAYVRGTADRGVTVTLGRDYAATATASPSTPASSSPGTLSSGVGNGTRSADDDPCANLSYG
ncbi:hypothetical protein GCM10010218_36410 [Streptomyces mashuensis]|uniref:Transcriptional regulator n=1 Tax=Streptomyces mashuensis TaxID=33904 RepID=A0A919B4B5_9ACTN|nr:LCP family protein [Streptomyces mashuensis]GHF51537.1 hypothetical protein GCM10010218_36410 [Streptomyces mashuensis]